MQSIPVRLAGAGTYLPGEPIPFHEIEEVLGELTGLSPEFKRWYVRTHNLMYQMLGMEYFHFALDRTTRTATESCAGMAAKASRVALANAGIQADEVDLIIYAGACMDHYFCPPTSTLVQQELGIKRCAELSVHSNCSASYKALELARTLIQGGQYKTVLVCSTNLVSPTLTSDFFNQSKMEKNQAILRWFLSDGAGAAVLRAEETDARGLYLIDTWHESVGADMPAHLFSDLGAGSGDLRRVFEAGKHHVSQDYRHVSHLGPKIFVDGFGRFMDTLKAHHGDVEGTRLVQEARFFLLNVASRHLIDLTVEELHARFRELKECAFDMYYSAKDNRGYTGPSMILQVLDRLLARETLHHNEPVISFVTESSKWINAGFVMRWQDRLQAASAQ
jgi:3-oxoacyl-[acyl-carrier-protein] synthase III